MFSLLIALFMTLISEGVEPEKEHLVHEGKVAIEHRDEGTLQIIVDELQN
jgi:hypothetical protein